MISNPRCPSRAVLAVVLLAGLAAFPARAEQALADREAEEARNEDAADRQAGEGKSSERTFRGKIVLGTTDDSSPDVVGVFVGDQGERYLLKPSLESVKKALESFNNKPVVLQGKLRNKGKYLVVTGVIPPPAAIPRESRRCGL
jgi:hypothetical protein